MVKAALSPCIALSIWMRAIALSVLGFSSGRIAEFGGCQFHADAHHGLPGLLAAVRLGYRFARISRSLLCNR